MRDIELLNWRRFLTLDLSRAALYHNGMVERNEDAIRTIHYNRPRKLHHTRYWDLGTWDVQIGGPWVAAPNDVLGRPGKLNGKADRIFQRWMRPIRATPEVGPFGCESTQPQ